MKVEFEELIHRLLKHPVITMDKQNVTADAALWLQHYRSRLERLASTKSMGRIVSHDADQSKRNDLMARIKYARESLEIED